MEWRVSVDLRVLLSTLIVIALAGTQPVTATTAEAVRVDDVALCEGVETRLGDTAAGWSISVTSASAETPQSLRVVLRGPAARSVLLEVDVLGTDPKARAVELAAAVSLAIEDAEATDARPELHAAQPESAEPERRRSPADSTTAGWVGADAQLATNANTDAALAGGGSLRGGLWLVGDHVQPTIAMVWGYGREGGLRVHAFSAEACGFAGGWVHARAWLGAGGCVGARRALAIDRARASRWGMVVGVPVRLQVPVHPRVMLGAEVGLRVSAPALRFVGAQDVTRWRRVRLMAGLGVAVTLGGGRPLASAER